MTKLLLTKNQMSNFKQLSSEEWYRLETRLNLTVFIFAICSMHWLTSIILNIETWNRIIIQDESVLQQCICDTHVRVHVHVGSVADSTCIQTQRNCRRMVGVDREVLQIRNTKNCRTDTNSSQLDPSHLQCHILHHKENQKKRQNKGKRRFR